MVQRGGAWIFIFFFSCYCVLLICLFTALLRMSSGVHMYAARLDSCVHYLLLSSVYFKFAGFLGRRRLR